MPESILWTLLVLGTVQFLAGTKKYYFGTFLQRNFDRARGKGTGFHLLCLPVYTRAYTQRSPPPELSRNLPGTLGAFPELSRRLRSLQEPSDALPEPSRSLPGAFPEPSWSLRSLPGTYLEPSEPSRSLPGAFPVPSRRFPGAFLEPSWSPRNFPGAFQELSWSP